jgi:hypothetical protein
MDNKEVKDFTSGYIFAWCTIDLVMSLNPPQFLTLFSFYYDPQHCTWYALSW